MQHSCGGKHRRIEMEKQNGDTIEKVDGAAESYDAMKPKMSEQENTGGNATLVSESSATTASSSGDASTAIASEAPRPAETASSDVAGDSGQEEESSTSSSSDKQKLRKGKWTIEEEEYTSRVIQYFSTGLLVLPDGATLRSYLAEKLNCDPMRITKKFTGACCLGRRAYHLRDRPRASPAEMEVARLELQHLEQRFLLRVEHEQSGLPLPPRHELLAAQPPTTTSSMTSIPSLLASLHGGAPVSNLWAPTSAPPPAVLANVAAVSPASNPFATAAALPGNPFNFSLPNANLNALAQSNLPLASQLLLQVTNQRIQANAAPTPATPDPSQAFNTLVASLFLAQAAANLNQQQQPPQLQQHQASIPVPAPAIAHPLSIPAPASLVHSDLSPPAPTRPANLVNGAPLPTLSVPGAVNGGAPFLAGSLPNANHTTQMPSPPLPNIQVVAKEEQLQQKMESSAQTNTLTKEQRLKAAYEEQQRALRLAFEESLKDAQEEERLAQQAAAQAKQAAASTKAITDTTANSGNASTSTKHLSPAELLQRSYEAHLASLQKAENDHVASSTTKTSAVHSNLKGDSGRNSKSGGKNKKNKVRGSNANPGKVEEDEGKQLMVGFLQSLRGSFEDAVGNGAGRPPKPSKAAGFDSTKKKKTKKKDRSSSSSEKESKKKPAEIPATSSAMASAKNDSSSQDFPKPAEFGNKMTSLDRFQKQKRKLKPASVTETSSGSSSQPTTEQSSSSLEDSDSKSDKTEQSSSSDEYENGDARPSSKGPPRKRLKKFTNTPSSDFTLENVMKHSQQMDMQEADGSGISSD